MAFATVGYPYSLSEDTNIFNPNGNSIGEIVEWVATDDNMSAWNLSGVGSKAYLQGENDMMSPLQNAEPIPSRYGGGMYILSTTVNNHRTDLSGVMTDVAELIISRVDDSGNLLWTKQERDWNYIYNGNRSPKKSASSANFVVLKDTGDMVLIQTDPFLHTNGKTPCLLCGFPHLGKS